MLLVSGGFGIADDNAIGAGVIEMVFLWEMDGISLWLDMINILLRLANRHDA